jgi:hypothetical protein
MWPRRAALIEPVEVHFQWRPQSSDPNHEMVLEAAINGRADALVTYNVSDFAAAAQRYNEEGRMRRERLSVAPKYTMLFATTGSVGSAPSSYFQSMDPVFAFSAFMS